MAARFAFRACVVGAGIALALGACGSPSDAPSAGPAATGTPTADVSRAPAGGLDLTAPSGRSTAKEMYFFDDVPAMTATADLVVRARVVGVATGASEYDPGDPSGRPVLTARIVTLEVQKVYRAAGEAPETVKVYEGHFNRAGAGIQNGGVTWTGEGAVGVYFLTLNPDTGIYLLVSTQGRVLIGEKGLESSAEEGSPLHRRIEGMTEDALDARIDKAAKDTAAGRIKPQKPI